MTPLDSGSRSRFFLSSFPLLFIFAFFSAFVPRRRNFKQYGFVLSRGPLCEMTTFLRVLPILFGVFHNTAAQLSLF